MEVVILAGGFGTRISEESHLKPKPMVEIGDHPILWHIMKYFSSYGHYNFIICLGYKGYYIKEYFSHLMLHESNTFIDFSDNDCKIQCEYKSEPWKVSLIDTGLNTMTGGRLKRIKPYLNNNLFFLTYGDGLSDVNLDELVKFHSLHNKIASVTATQPQGRFGALSFSDDERVVSFQEKPSGDGGWINSGFFIMDKRIFNYIDNDEDILERSPLESLSKDNELMGYKHHGFFQPMDTLRDKKMLEELWNNKKAPWKRW